MLERTNESMYRTDQVLTVDGTVGDVRVHAHLTIFAVVRSISDGHVNHGTEIWVHVELGPRSQGRHVARVVKSAIREVSNTCASHWTTRRTRADQAGRQRILAEICNAHTVALDRSQHRQTQENSSTVACFDSAAPGDTALMALGGGHEWLSVGPALCGRADGICTTAPGDDGFEKLASRRQAEVAGIVAAAVHVVVARP